MPKLGFILTYYSSLLQREVTGTVVDDQWDNKCEVEVYDEKTNTSVHEFVTQAMCPRIHPADNPPPGWIMVVDRNYVVKQTDLVWYPSTSWITLAENQRLLDDCIPGVIDLYEARAVEFHGVAIPC